MYINENWPTSNSKEGISYILVTEGSGPRKYNTVDDLDTAIQYARNNALSINYAVRMAYGIPAEFTPETRREKTDRENRAHCKSIAKDFDAYANGEIYRCPECGEEIQLPENVGDKFKCYQCGEVSDVDDLEQLSLWDYLTDILDIEYRIGSDKELRSVQIMVTCGGPNIYIDSASKSVELYWWGDRASYPISYDAAAALDEWAEELYQC